MATVTKPIALDESLHTTEQAPRNVADVLAQELARIAGRQASDVEYDNSGSGLSATDVQNALDEIVSDIPTVNDGTLTIQQNGATKGTFTANQSGNSTVNIETPTTDIQTAVDEFSTFNGGLLSECKVNLSPIQDLHGYSEPWVGGAGKNLYQMRTTSITQNGITVTANADGTLDISGTATATTQIILCDNLAELATKLNNGGTFTLSLHNATYNSNTFNVSITYVQGGTTKWITPNSPATVASGNYTVNSILYIGSGVTVSTVQNFAIQLEEGSTATDYEPYSNICPISGHTQVVVGDDGKNLFDPTGIISGKRLTNIIGNAYNSTQDVIAESNSFVSSLIKVTQGNIVTKNSPNEDAYHRWHIYDNNGICVRYPSDNVITIGSGESYVALCGVNSEIDTTQIRQGYQVTVNLGGTYYSGILDVVSGVFVPDKAEVDLGSLSWTRITTNVFRASNSGMEVVADNVTADLTCEIYKKGNYTGLGDGEIAIRLGNQVWVRDSTVDDATIFTNQVNEKKFVYPLATPLTIQLSPTMVKALVGENHLSAPLEGQEITESKYKQMFTFDDVIAYIQSLS